MVVQHVLEPGWSPSASLGSTYGSNAASNSKTLGLPAGVNVWCDLEGVDSATELNSVVSYCNNWFDAVAQEGYTPGLYVGYSSILNGEQLYNDLKFQHYWRSTSDVPEVANRGYQLIQSNPDTNVNGIAIDEDNTQTDEKGGQAQILSPSMILD